MCHTSRSQQQQSNATSTTSLEPGTLTVHTVVSILSGTNCGASTQAPIPRKTLKHKVRLRKPFSNPCMQKVNKTNSNVQVSRFSCFKKPSEAVSRQTLRLFAHAVLEPRSQWQNNQSNYLHKHARFSWFLENSFLENVSNGFISNTNELIWFRLVQKPHTTKFVTTKPS